MHHRVEITDPAIVAAATLSHRYIADRQLPDKAIDLIDEAAARIRMEIDSKPEALDRLERRIIQLKIEREALKKEKDEASRKRLRDAARRRSSELEKRIRRPRGGLEVREGRAAGRRPDPRGARAARAWSWRRRAAPATSARMAELQYGRMPELEKRLAAGAAPPKTRTPQLVRNKVTEEEIAEVVSKWTGIPVVQDARGREGKAAAHGRARSTSAWSARTRRCASSPNAIRRSRAGLVRSAPPERLVPVPRAHRRRQDRAVQGAGRIPVRYRGGHGPHRHVRVHGEALGGAPDRRAAGLRRLRGGRLSDRGGAPPAVRGDPAR